MRPLRVRRHAFACHGRNISFDASVSAGRHPDRDAVRFDQAYLAVKTVITGYTAREQFRPLHRRKQRWAISVCHRRAGKTVAHLNDLIDAALRCDRPKPRFAYVAPYYGQAKDIAWDYLVQYTSAIPGSRTHATELRVDLPGDRRVRLYGADNYHRIEGVYLDGVVCDEYQLWDPRAFPESIRPMLSDRNGWAAFCGKPGGTEHFNKMWDRAQLDDAWYTQILRASESGILPPSELADARTHMTEDQYNAEYECSFSAKVVGSVFGVQVEEAEREGRICPVPWQPEFAVSTWWDIGTADSTVIWFTQDAGREVHVIDYLEDAGAGKGIDYYLRLLQGKPYTWGTHNGPHDFASNQFAAGGRSSEKIALGLGFKFNIIPRVDHKHNSINAGRVFMKRCWFDRLKCERGLRALRAYHYEWNEKNKIFSNEPKHDWASNGADAYQQLAMGHRSVRPPQYRKLETEYRPMPRGSEDRSWMGL